MRTLRLAALGVALLLATGARAGTIDADAGDFDVIGFGGAGLVAGATTDGVAKAGDALSVDQTSRYLVRFPLDALPDDFATATLEVAIVSTQTDGVADDAAPFANPGLGDLLARPVPDYATPDAADYAAAAEGDAVVLVASGAEAPAIASADVTQAVRDAQGAALPFATFRIETAVETDVDQRNDVFFLATADAADPASRPVLVYAPETSAATASLAALAALVARAGGRRSPAS